MIRRFLANQNQENTMTNNDPSLVLGKALLLPEPFRALASTGNLEITSADLSNIPKIENRERRNQTVMNEWSVSPAASCGFISVTVISNQD